MSVNEPGPAANWPAAPPTSPGPLPTTVQRPAWPTVLGVIAIVLGVLGTIGGLWGILGVALMRGFAGAMPANVNITNVSGWAEWTIPLSAAAAALGLVLLAGGVGLLRRRDWGCRVLLCWAPLKMALVVGNGVLAWLVQQQVLPAQMSAASSPVFSQTAGSATTVTVFATTGAVLGVLWGWALPVFLLIWFARRTTRAQVAQWARN